VETLTWIAPQEVQIYTTDRPVAEAKVEKVPKAILLEMAKEAEARTRDPRAGLLTLGTQTPWDYSLSKRSFTQARTAVVRGKPTVVIAKSTA
jgi:hypothetical protein